MSKKYVALLRGVMPFGKNKVPMAQLRVILEKAGFRNVQTYIQSGNVLLESSMSPSDIATAIHDEIAKHLGGDIAVVITDPSELSEILKQNPFASKEKSSLYFVFLGSSPKQDLLESLAQEDLLPSEWAMGKNVIYLYCPQSYSKSKINNNYIEKRLRVAATTRNYNTVSKLVELSS